MKLTNDSYLILIGTKHFTERYYRNKAGWLKVSARGRTFRMTAEQVLNHILPALAGVKPGLTITVEHPAVVGTPRREVGPSVKPRGKLPPRSRTSAPARRDRKSGRSQ